MISLSSASRDERVVLENPFELCAYDRRERIVHTAGVQRMDASCPSPRSASWAEPR